MHQDSLSLWPVQSSIPTVDIYIEQIGSISHPSIAEEENVESTTTSATIQEEDSPKNANDNSIPDLLHSDDDSSTSSSKAKLEDEMDIENFDDEDVSPQLTRSLISTSTVNTCSKA